MNDSRVLDWVREGCYEEAAALLEHEEKLAKAASLLTQK